MKLRGLMIAAVVLAALSGTLYWSNHRKPNADTVKASPDASPKILSLNEADITQLSIKKKGEPEINLANSDGTWKITEPKPLGADQQSVSSMLSTLASLNADRMIEEKVSNPAEYGLAEPALEVDVTTKDKKTQKLLVGDQTPTGSASYAMLSGDPRVFTLASYNKSSIDKTAGDLRDKRLLTADLDKVSQIELVTEKQDITFGRNRDEWQILKPKPCRADSFQVEELIRALRNAKLESGVSDADAKKSASAFQSGKPLATAKVTSASGTQELQVRKNKDDYYAKSSAVEGIYKVSSEVGTGLNKTLDDFRNKKLFDFGFEDPNKIEFHDGAKAYFLTRSGEDWWSGDGKKLDNTAVQSFIGKVRSLSAAKFPGSGFSTAAIEITVISNDNKRTEKVLLSKTEDAYVAKRENEPSLYQLDASAVTELEKAAADLKPAPPPAPHKK